MTTTLRSVFGDHVNNRVSLTVSSHPSLASDGSGSDSEGDDVVVISGDGDGDGGGEGLCPFNLLAICMSS